MKNRLIIFFVVVGSVISIRQSEAQIPAVPPVVSVPGLELRADADSKVLNRIRRGTEALEKIQRKAEASKSSTQWLFGMGSFRNFLDIIETMACTIHDIKANFSIVNSLNLGGDSCLDEFIYGVSMTNLRKVADLTTMILNKRRNLSNSERLGLFTEAFDTFVEAQTELYDLNLTLEERIEKQERRENAIAGYLRIANTKRYY